MLLCCYFIKITAAVVLFVLFSPPNGGARWSNNSTAGGVGAVVLHFHPKLSFAGGVGPQNWPGGEYYWQVR